LAEYWWQIHRSDIYHEAGHTVVASAEGWSVAEIFFNRVDPDAACRYEDRALLSAADHHEALRVAVGGTITEAIHLGDDPSRRLRELLRAGCAEADRGNALPDDRASIRALEPSAGCTASEVVENTERLLRRRWRDVEALVQALDERARATADPLVLVALKGSDVRRLIGGPPAVQRDRQLADRFGNLLDGLGRRPQDRWRARLPGARRLPASWPVGLTSGSGCFCRASSPRAS